MATKQELRYPPFVAVECQLTSAEAEALGVFLGIFERFLAGGVLFVSSDERWAGLLGAMRKVRESIEARMVPFDATPAAPTRRSRPPRKPRELETRMLEFARRAAAKCAAACD